MLRKWDGTVPHLGGSVPHAIRQNQHDQSRSHAELSRLLLELVLESEWEIHKERFQVTPSSLFEQVWMAVLARNHNDASADAWRSLRMAAATESAGLREENSECPPALLINWRNLQMNNSMIVYRTP